MLIKHLALVPAAAGLLLVGSALHAQSTNNGTTSVNDDLSPPELILPPVGSFAITSNQASITQASDLNIAYISQTGVGNYALINQSSNNASLAVIIQTGNFNRSTIIQR
jgi:hypothetical protein